MPSLEKDFLYLLKDDFKKYPCFIETGTYQGNTVISFEPYFNNLYTIEISEYLYNTAKCKYNGNKIKFILGDSSIVLKELLPKIREKCIFFLDGHYSSENTGRGQKDCPLNEEIENINEFLVNEAIIIIDDFRLFGLDIRSGKLSEDWSYISKDNILNILKDRIKDVYTLDSSIQKDDRLIIHIYGKKITLPALH
jgi:hypothetical protein